MTRATAGF